MRISPAAAVTAVLAGGLLAGAVDFKVVIRQTVQYAAPEPFAKPVAEFSLGDNVEGTPQGEWVKISVKDRPDGWIHRSSLATEEEVMQDPELAFRIAGTGYPVDVQEQDSEVRVWLLNPVVRSTPPAPRPFELDAFRAAGELGGKK